MMLIKIIASSERSDFRLRLNSWIVLPYLSDAVIFEIVVSSQDAGKIKKTRPDLLENINFLLWSDFSGGRAVFRYSKEGGM